MYQWGTDFRDANVIIAEFTDSTIIVSLKGKFDMAIENPKLDRLFPLVWYPFPTFFLGNQQYP
jgi:hypothetical protein